MHFSNVKAANRRTHQPIGARRERCIEFGLVRRQLVHVLNLVEVERELARDAAVDAGLQVGGPVLVQNVLATGVLFADAGNPRVDRLAAVDVLHGRFPEEEIDVLADVKRSDKVGFCAEKEGKMEMS